MSQMNDQIKDIISRLETGEKTASVEPKTDVLIPDDASPLVKELLKVSMELKDDDTNFEDGPKEKAKAEPAKEEEPAHTEENGAKEEEKNE